MIKYCIIKTLIMLMIGVWTIAFIKTGMKFDGFWHTFYMTTGVFPAIFFSGEFLEANLKNKFNDKENK